MTSLITEYDVADRLVLEAYMTRLLCRRNDWLKQELEA